MIVSDIPLSHNDYFDQKLHIVVSDILKKLDLIAWKILVRF